VTEHRHDDTTIKSQGLLRFSAVLTGVTFIAELVGGLWANSLALLSDSGHVLIDLTALLISFFALWLSNRPMNNRRTFGLHRLEVFAALMNGALVAVIAVWIILESIERLDAPPPVRTGPMLAIAALGLIANLIVAWRLHDFSRHDVNIRGAFLHVAGDALASIGVVIGGLLIRWTGNPVFDPLVGFFVALIIVVNAARVLKDAVEILLEGVPKNMTLEEVVSDMKNVPGVIRVDDAHVWNICSHLRSMSAHVTLPPEARDRQRDVLAALSQTLKSKFQINHTTIQIEFSDWKNPGDGSPETELLA
jgi:cobalt-zinc-cadmium efflux system protein